MNFLKRLFGRKSPQRAQPPGASEAVTTMVAVRTNEVDPAVSPMANAERKRDPSALMSSVSETRTVAVVESHPAAGVPDVPSPDAAQPAAERQNTEDQVPAVWQPGDVILDLYEVQQVFESGGMGLVYQVHHKGWNLPLAVKSPRAEWFESDQDKQNFEREAETWVNLGLHPNIVSCHYVRRLGGIPRVFAEYMEGGSLKDWIDSGKLYTDGPESALERMLDIAIQFAWGLHYAHEQGLIHQDVKPANVLMTHDGIAKVSDFGLAKAQPAHRNVTASRAGASILVTAGGMMTPAYCSPEQADQQPLSRRTDLWSWAVSLLEMFTGDVTWGSGVAAAEALEGYLDAGGSGDDRIPLMPTEVADLLKRCFQRDPAQRPSDMLEIASRLQQLFARHFGRSYTRAIPKQTESLADGLNNRAVSLLDLGKQDAAEQCWQQALQTHPQHLEVTFNQGLSQWRTGRITDLDLVSQMRGLADHRPGDWLPLYLLSQIHLERGDIEAAATCLDGIGEADVGKSEIAPARAQANEAAREATRLERNFAAGHYGSVTSLDWSQDGKLAVSGGEDCTVRVWDVATGKCLHTIEAHERKLHVEVRSVCLSADGRLALSCTNGESAIHLWDTATGARVQTFADGTSGVLALHFSADGNRFLAGSMDGSLRLWERATGKVLRQFQGHSRVEAVFLSQDGSRALTGGGGAFGHPKGEVRFWNADTGECLQDFEGSFHPVGSVCLIADNRLALAGGTGALGDYVGELLLWDTSSGKQVRAFVPHRGAVSGLALSPDGRYALSGNGITPGSGLSATPNDVFRLWNVATGKCLRTFPDEHRLSTICLSGDGQHALIACATGFQHKDSALAGSIKLWRINARDYRFSAQAALCRAVTSEKASGAEEAYHRGLEAARSALEKGDANAVVRSLRDARALPGCSRRPEAVSLWQELYTRLKRKTLVGAWETATWTEHQSEVMSISLSPDGRQALTGSGRSDSDWNAPPQVKLWDIATNKSLTTLEAGKGTLVSTVCFSSDGRYAVAAGGKNIMLGDFTVWRLPSGERLNYLSRRHPHQITSASLTPDGRHLLTFSSGWLDDPWQVKVWDTSSVRCLRTLKGVGDFGSEYCYCLAMSPDGQQFLVGGGAVYQWELTSGRCVRKFQKSENTVSSLCFSTDGRLVLGGGGKRLVLWDANTGHLLQQFVVSEEEVSAIAITPDGRFAFSAGRDKMIRIWEIASGRNLATLGGHREDVNCLALTPDGRLLLSGSHDKTVKVWLLDWELQEAAPADWDEGARPLLAVHLTLHTPCVKTLPLDCDPTPEELASALTRNGKPIMTDADFLELLFTLGCAGYGWLRPKGVRRELNEMAANWQGPPPLG